MNSLKRYSLTCEHHGRIKTIIMRSTVALSEQDALIKFLAWHDATYKRRRAYNVKCSPVEIFVVW